MSDRPAEPFRIPGGDGAAIAARVRERIADRIARGILSDEDVRRVTEARLPSIAADDDTLEAFRNCCTTWEVDRTAPVTSHRPVVGWVLVPLKRLVRRALRFQTEAFLERQRHFNWNVMLVLREILERTDWRDS